MDRTVEYLLRKYETKQPGEEWEIKTEVKYVKEYQYKQRLFLLDGIINNLHGSFKLNKPQKDRIKYLIQLQPTRQIRPDNEHIRKLPSQTKQTPYKQDTITSSLLGHYVIYVRKNYF